MEKNIDFIWMRKNIMLSYTYHFYNQTRELIDMEFEIRVTYLYQVMKDWSLAAKLNLAEAIR